MHELKKRIRKKWKRVFSYFLAQLQLSDRKAVIGLEKPLQTTALPGFNREIHPKSVAVIQLDDFTFHFMQKNITLSKDDFEGK